MNIICMSLEKNYKKKVKWYFFGKNDDSLTSIQDMIKFEECYEKYLEDKKEENSSFSIKDLTCDLKSFTFIELSITYKLYRKVLFMVKFDSSLFSKHILRWNSADYSVVLPKWVDSKNYNSKIGDTVSFKEMIDSLFQTNYQNNEGDYVSFSSLLQVLTDPCIYDKIIGRILMNYFHLDEKFQAIYISMILAIKKKGCTPKQDKTFYLTNLAFTSKLSPYTSTVIIEADKINVRSSDVNPIYNLIVPQCSNDFYYETEDKVYFRPGLRFIANVNSPQQLKVEAIEEFEDDISQKENKSSVLESNLLIKEAKIEPNKEPPIGKEQQINQISELKKSENAEENSNSKSEQRPVIHKEATLNISNQTKVQIPPPSDLSHTETKKEDNPILIPVESVISKEEIKRGIKLNLSSSTKEDLRNMLMKEEDYTKYYSVNLSDNDLNDYNLYIESFYLFRNPSNNIQHLYLKAVNLGDSPKMFLDLLNCLNNQDNDNCLKKLDISENKLYKVWPGPSLELNSFFTYNCVNINLSRNMLGYSSEFFMDLSRFKFLKTILPRTTHLDLSHNHLIRHSLPSEEKINRNKLLQDFAKQHPVKYLNLQSNNFEFIEEAGLEKIIET